ncbi:MAG TPA: TIGR01777 family oxidoreductase [Thermodesulfobacteriota bacterium]|nr:TIGR01777 family oxidoreductase [Thermodesulfobacteriota bacterium]
MRILVTGSTGLVGSALVPFLTKSGHGVTRLTRSKNFSGGKIGESVAYWNPNAKNIDSAALEGHEAVVHLAGENVAGIWTQEKKKRIRKSRVEGTRLLSRSLAELGKPPRVLVCASAVGYYGNRGDEILTEESESGEGFLAEVCREWELACEPALEKGIRVVNLRIGLVLSPEGGALKTMLTPFRLGVGGTIGSGNQYISWISIDDMVGVIHHAISKENLKGPVNSVAPNPVTNREFTKTLARVLRRPSFLSVPEFALRILTGEMAEEMLLASTRALPKKLLDTGYKFRYPELEGALRYLLGRTENKL